MPENNLCVKTKILFETKLHFVFNLLTHIRTHGVHFRGTADSYERKVFDQIHHYLSVHGRHRIVQKAENKVSVLQIYCERVTYFCKIKLRVVWLKDHY